MTALDDIAAYDPATGYSASDDSTCCEDCHHYIWPDDDYGECTFGFLPGPFGGWVDGLCDSWKPSAEIERLDRREEAE